MRCHTTYDNVEQTFNKQIPIAKTINSVFTAQDGYEKNHDAPLNKTLSRSKKKYDLPQVCT